MIVPPIPINCGYEWNTFDTGGVCPLQQHGGVSISRRIGCYVFWRPVYLTSDQPWQTMSKTSLLEVKMDWSCFAEELYIGDWRVEGRDRENEGQVYVAIFSGPKARERAQEYADWKISKEQPRPRLHKVG